MADPKDGSGQLDSITKSFDQYEYVAIIIPGATLLLGLWLIFYGLPPATFDKDIGLGALGTFVIASFVVGQMVRALGDIVERLFWWCLGGMPTNWVVASDQALIDAGQRTRLEERVKKLTPSATDLASYASKRAMWLGITREIYSMVSNAGRSARIDSFNRTLGMMNGLTVALTVIGAAALVRAQSHAWPWVEIAHGATALALAWLTWCRFYHFSKAYARELLVQFIQLPA